MTASLKPQPADDLDAPAVPNDDVFSFGGSLAGGTLVSRQGRGGAKAGRLARQMREFHAKSDDLSAVLGLERDNELATVRCNTSFHHFRFLVVFMSGFSIALMLMMRYGISISILKMVNQTHLYLEDHPNKTLDDFLAQGYIQGGEFNWNNEIVSIILSWYMIAYTIPQIPATQWAVKIGCHKTVTISLLMCALSLLLTPLAARYGWQYVVAMRFLNGVGASPMIAISLNIIEIWMRQDELSLGLTITQTVCSTMMFTPLFVGFLAEIHWAYSFYVPAILSLAFCLVWFLVAADRPQDSRLISEKELRYILESNYAQSSGIKKAAKDQTQSINGSESKSQKADDLDGWDEKPSSWVQIFKVPSFYAYIVTWTMYCCANHAYIFILPTYLSQFLKVSVIDNGFYGFLINVGCILPVIWPHLIHKLLLKCGLSLTVSRMVLQTLSCLGVISTWSYVSLFHDNQIAAFFLNRCFFGANDILFPASLMANYGQAGLTSVAFSVMNSISDILIVPTSTFIGWMLDHTGQSRVCWSWIFISLALAQVILWVLFLVCIDSNPVRFKRAKSEIDKMEQQQQQQQKKEKEAKA